VGGLLVLIGLFVSVMIVAIGTVHGHNGLLASTNGVELPLLYGVAGMCLGLPSPAEYSIDSVFGLTSSCHLSW
jgi:hypothetical protein